jgi:hypothetical protein
MSDSEFDASQEPGQVEAGGTRDQPQMPLAAHDALKPLLPDLSKTLGLLVAQNMGSSYLSSIAKMNTDFLASLDLMPKIDLPIIKIDTSAMLPNLDKFAQSITKMIQPAMTALFDSYRVQFADLAKNFSKILGTSFPPNWQGEELIKLPKNLETMLLDEGLPLAWVPPRPVLEKVFAAHSAGARRTVLSNNWRCIVEACVAELDGVNEPRLMEYVEFATEAAESLRDGRWRASQALSANLMDSILNQSFDKASKKRVTDQKTRVGWEDYPIRLALVIGGIWGSHSEYWPSKGDPIPRRYTRHASAHGVSRRQYARLNAVIAVMHIVGLLKVIESGLVLGRGPFG